MKSGLLAFGTLIWAATAFAQPAPDPLAPLPASPPKSPRSFPSRDTAVPILGMPETPPQPDQQQPVAVPAVQPPAVAQQTVTTSPRGVEGALPVDALVRVGTKEVALGLDEVGRRA